MNKIYVFYYNFDVYESAASAMSFHTTLEGAYKAMKKYLYYQYDLWLHQDKWNRVNYKFGCYESWFIKAQEINND